jgi:hypothetical protein
MPTEPFEIWGHGGGCFGCFKDAWLGFHHDFKGFGGEEGYLPSKYRKHSRKVWSLPFLKWIHRFGEGKGAGYPLLVEDRIRNYLIGHIELGIDESRLVEHFGKDAVEKERAKLNISQDIICCCPTYGRYGCLSETVESFLRQNYQAKHMLVFNDDPRVKYHIDNKLITVVNLESRCSSLGDKFNKMLDYAIKNFPGRLLMIWPQDDIMLPWALSEISSRFKEARVGCCYPKGRWFSMRNEIEKFEPTAVSPLALFSEEFYRSVGGYQDVSVGEDVAFMSKAKAATNGTCISGELGKNKAYHIYRWANKNYHVSGFNKAIAWEKCKEEVERTMSAGSYKIIPSWAKDYIAETRRLL